MTVVIKIGMWWGAAEWVGSVQLARRPDGRPMDVGFRLPGALPPEHPPSTSPPPSLRQGRGGCTRTTAVGMGGGGATGAGLAVGPFEDGAGAGGPSPKAEVDHHPDRGEDWMGRVRRARDGGVSVRCGLGRREGSW